MSCKPYLYRIDKKKNKNHQDERFKPRTFLLQFPLKFDLAPKLSFISCLKSRYVIFFSTNQGLGPSVGLEKAKVKRKKKEKKKAIPKVRGKQTKY